MDLLQVKAVRLATGKAPAKVSNTLPPSKPQPSSSSDNKIDLGGVKDTGVKVVKKVIDTGVNMVKNPLRQSFKTLTTNEELSIDQQMKISRDAGTRTEIPNLITKPSEIRC